MQTKFWRYISVERLFLENSLAADCHLRNKKLIFKDFTQIFSTSSSVY